jgi:carbon-monoxide dehydrogenase iron sulfur subunit
MITGRKEVVEIMSQNDGREGKLRGWGKENYPYPPAVAFIECDEMKCIGCGICQMACSMQHHGLLNKDLARIQVSKHLLPISKGIQVTCSQCQEEERQCEKACPLKPPAVYYDKNLFHMVLDQERCLGPKCLLCRKACSAKAIRNHPALSPKPFVCDLCDTENNGKGNPQCVNICPTGALYYKNLEVHGTPLRDIMRKPADEKAELIAKRLYPLPKDIMWLPRKGE